MGYVQSLGSLATLETGWWPSGSYGALRLYDRFDHTYAEMYRTQPNVRVCVDFLARNIAQLGLHVYRRVGETDRERLRDHPLARLLARPNPWTTTYRLIEALVADHAVYHNAYWLKVRGEDARADSGGRVALLRVPPHLVQVSAGLVPVGYTIALGARTLKARPDAVVHYRGYNPDAPGEGLSPLETLRRILAEEHAAGEYRENLWQNAARMNGIIERPVDATDWSDTARERFQAEFEALYSGAANSGKTAILEEGMKWQAISFSPRDAEYLAGRKLTREECARAYHIPLPMVGILDHATFSNIKEQHKNLYQDSLGPWLAMIEQEITLQLLPEFGDSDGVYVEFNIAEKLQGSFEEQTQALQSAVGRPWMTANEARARMNLPSLDGADRLVTPLNVLMGTQASPRDSAPPKAVTIGAKAAEEGSGGGGGEAPEPEDAEGTLDASLPAVRGRHEAKWREVLEEFFRRQWRVIASRLGALGVGPELAAVWRDQARWDRELAADLYALYVATATVWAKFVARALEAEEDLVEELLYDYLSEAARIMAENVNAVTRREVEAALEEDDYAAATEGVFDRAAAVRAPELATTAVTRAASFGSQEAAKQGGFQWKTWVVQSTNPRSHHAAMDGETVAIGERFSNGLLWPGDPSAGAPAEEIANCQCGLRFSR